MAEGQVKGLREGLVTTPENLSWPKKQTPGPQNLQQPTTKQEGRTAVVVQSSLSPSKVTEEIKKNIDPAEIGLKDVNIQPSREGVVTSSSRKSGLKGLNEVMQQNKNLKKQVMTKLPKEKLQK